jgi:hypothetical protein
MSDEGMNFDYSQYSLKELYTLLDQELNSDKKESILNELSKRLKSSFEEIVSDASKPPVVPPQYRREEVLPVVPTNPDGGNVSGTQNDGSSATVIFLAVIVGIGMLMAGM